MMRVDESVQASESLHEGFPNSNKNKTCVWDYHALDHAYSKNSHQNLNQLILSWPSDASYNWYSYQLFSSFAGSFTIELLKRDI